jgi:hypothetical protein
MYNAGVQGHPLAAPQRSSDLQLALASAEGLGAGDQAVLLAQDQLDLVHDPMLVRPVGTRYATVIGCGKGVTRTTGWIA